MMRGHLPARAFRVLALAVAPLAACGGAPEPPQPASPISIPAIAPEADAGPAPPAPLAEPPSAAVPPDVPPPTTAPSGTADAVQPPIAAVDPPAPPTAPPPPPAAPETPCGELRALKAAAPLFARPPLPCDRADRLSYYRRAADGTCGASLLLHIAADGTATAGAVGSCPPAKTARPRIDPGDARRLIASACAAVNDSYSLEHGIGCASAAVRLYFFEGAAKLGETAALPCPPHALDRVVAEVEAIAAGLR
jgi:hypothetical protein